MQYLGTNEIGFDPDVLGFPSVKTCQAIVYETATGLYGLHDALGNPAAFPAKCSAFAQFVQELLALLDRGRVNILTRRGNARAAMRRHRELASPAR